MGLDMYLTKKTYVQNWDHMTAAERHVITIQGPEAANIKPERISYIEEQVAYWRKANQIHKWFVEKCQGGVDECQTTYVSHEQLAMLVEECEACLTDPKNSKNILPTQPGFFFGNVEYNQYYFDDLKHTVRQLKPLLKEKGEFYYRSSW